MFAVVKTTSMLFNPSVIHTCVLVMEGIVVYVAISLAIKSDIAHEAIMILKRRFLEKRHD
jgi:hypothetical protein